MKKKILIMIAMCLGTSCSPKPQQQQDLVDVNDAAMTAAYILGVQDAANESMKIQTEGLEAGKEKVAPAAHGDDIARRAIAERKKNCAWKWRADIEPK